MHIIPIFVKVLFLLDDRIMLGEPWNKNILEYLVDALE